MRNFFKSLFAESPQAPAAAIPEGERVYAVGDIHGRRDLFDALIKAIEHDDAKSGKAETTVILLGDLVDRGPDSAGVLRLARKWQKHRKVRILAGNHEEMFLRSFEEKDVLRHFLRHGGKETILSYGVDKKEFTAASLKEVQQLMRKAVPEKHIAFLQGFENMIEAGDYLFVHAGIDPARTLDKQKAKDLRWIREPFLSHGEAHERVVVHGHTITDAPEDMGNRIGVDTGAYASGCLTALVLEGTERRYLSTYEDEDGKIHVRK